MAHFSSLSSSGVSSCYSGMDLDRCEEEESDEEDAFISFTTTESKCEQLYEQGLQFKCQGDLPESLSSFLGCLASMQECQYFSKLPQTLHQLTELYQSLQLAETAEMYSKAEKLFYEAIITEPPVTKDKEAKPKTKRRPFGKKPRAASSSNVCNPAEYGNCLTKKAEMFENLARVYAAECNFDLAKEYTDKAASIRQTVLGESCRSSSDYTLYSGAVHVQDVHSAGMLKGHLSKAEHIGTVCENEVNGSTFCGAAQINLSHTTGNNGALYPLLYPAHKDPCTQTENTFNDNRQVTTIPFEDATTSGATTSGATTDSRGLCFMEQEQQPPIHQEGCIPVPQECAHVRDSRQEGIHKDSKEIHPGSKGIRSDLCTGATRPLLKFSEFKNPMRKFSEFKNPMCKLSNPMSKLSELKKPMSKLSELKNPMCVHLDLHKGPGEGVEPTRCLPLWILLLPAVLALVGYVMYYH